MAQSIKRRRNIYFGGTIVFVLFLFSYYFFVYIPTREKEMNERGIRVINRMIKNVQEREDHYNKSLEMFECDYRLKRTIAVAREEGKSPTEIYDELIDKYEFSKCATIVKRIDKLENEVFYNDEHLYQIDTWEEFDRYIIETLEKETKLDNRVEFGTVKDTSNYPYFKLLTDSIDSFCLAINAENFLKGIKSFEYFSDVFTSLGHNNDAIIDDSKLSFKYFNYHPSVVANTAADSLLNGLEKDASGMYKIPNVDIVKRRIAGEDYFCYTANLTIQGKPYYLTGLIELDRYNGQVRSVSIWVLLVSVVFLLFLAQILPIIKPFVISRKERLGGIDVIWSALALVFGMSAITLIIFGIDSFIVEDIHVVNDKLRLYAADIKKSFKEETIATIELLDLVDGAGNSDEKLQEIDQENFKNQVRFLKINPNGFAKYFQIKVGKGVSGEEVLDKKTTDFDKKFTNTLQTFKDYTDTNLDLSHRKYFKVLADPTLKEAWAMGNTKYYVQSLFSLSKGKYETVVNVRAKDGSMLAAVKPFESVNNVLLEPNYRFAIIDKSGAIHYHTDQSKITNENILEESVQNEDLHTYLQNNGIKDFELSISLRDYQAHIEPIEGTPFHILTFYDIKKSRLTVTSSMTVVFELLIMVLFYLFLLHLLLKVGSNLSTSKKNREFLYSFLSPLKTSPIVYVGLTILNVISIVMLVVVYRLNTLNLMYSITAFLGILSFTLLFTYKILSRNTFQIDLEIKEIKRKSMFVFELVLAILSFIWLVSQIYLNRELNDLAYFLAFYQVLLFALYVAARNDKLRKPKPSTPKSYKAFFVHAFTWVLMVSFLPTMLFMKPVFNLQHINRGINNSITDYDSHREQGSFIDRKRNVFKPSNEVEDIGDSALYAALKFIDPLSPYFDPTDAKLKGQYTGAKLANGTRVCLEYDSKQKMPYFSVNYAQAEVTNEPSNKKLKPIQVAAFELPNPFVHAKVYDLLFWLVILLFFILLWVVVQKLSQYFFYLDLIKQLNGIKQKRGFGQASERDIVQKPTISKDQHNIMLVGPPFSGRNFIAKKLTEANREYIDLLNGTEEEKNRLKNIEDEVKEEVRKYRTAKDGYHIRKKAILEKENLSDIDKKQELKELKKHLKKLKNNIGKCIVINNFDYRIYDFDNNREKLDFIERIIRFRNQYQLKKRLVLICNFGTAQLISIYQNHIKELKRLNADAKEINKLIKDLYRWESVFYEFTKHIIAIPHSQKDGWLYHELDHGNALSSLIPQLDVFAERLEDKSVGLNEFEKRERLIDAIMDLAQNYYFSIWGACSRKEKFLLYDMAEDGLVNSKNDDVIYDLVRKGVLITEPHLRIFNDSFARFVLENITEEEGTVMEREAKKEGTFGMYRYMVIFLIIIIVVFLSFVEKDVAGRIISILTISATLLPRILSSLGSLKLSNFSFKKGA